MALIRKHRGLAAIIVVFLLLGLIYDWASPVLEVYDELWHYPVIEHIKDGNGLPVQQPGVETDFRQEGSQPPLYYALMAVATAWIDTSDFERVYARNPFGNLGWPDAPDNKNIMLHDPAEQTLPYHGTVLAVHFIRWLSLLLAAVGVAFTYFSCRVAFPGRDWLAIGASSFHAFNPTFLHISASVNNDTLAITASTIALYLTLKFHQSEHHRGWRWLLGLGSVLAVGVLAKISTLTILPVVGLTVLLAVWRQRDGRLLARAAVFIGGVPLLLAGWWFARNLTLYGEVTGMEMMVRIAGARPAGFTVWSLLEEWEGFRRSFWGVFGGFNLVAPEWYYHLFDTVSLAAVLGLILWVYTKIVKRQGVGWPIVLMALWGAIVFVSLIRWTTMTSASQGRLVFVAMAAWSTLLALGLGTLAGTAAGLLKSGRVYLHSAWGPSATYGLLTFPLAAFAAGMPIFLIQPAFFPPPHLPIDPNGVPNQTGIVFDDRIALVGYEMDRETVRVGEAFNLTLYWRALAPMDDHYCVYVHLVDGQPTEKLAERNSYPQGGRLSPRFFAPGKIVQDTHIVKVERAPENGLEGQILVGLFNVKDGRRLRAVDSQGHSANERPLGSLKVPIPPRLPDGFTERVADFSGRVRLEGYRFAPDQATPGVPIQVTLYWQALAPMDRDYTIFAQLIDENERLVGQNDHQPVQGKHPTSHWQPGTWVVDAFTITADDDSAPGPYRLRVGWYDLATGRRLDVLATNGQRVDDQVLLPGLRIE